MKLSLITSFPPCYISTQTKEVLSLSVKDAMKDSVVSTGLCWMKMNFKFKLIWN